MIQAASFLVAMKGYFGCKKDQTPMEFGREVMKLTHEEKLEFHEMLAGAGISCPLPVKAEPK